MRFWDASAIVPLLFAEPTHAAARADFERDPEMVAWWGTSIECVSAIARREREGSLSSDGMASALRRLDGLAASWHEVEPTSRVRLAATRLLRVHALRAADALQLAAAIVASEDGRSLLILVTYDERLADAAAREGFDVVAPR